jgi:predicted phosphoadenosine phosphosulfate sulfurtransferase
MRVSNYHHETAVHALFMLQEIEPATYEAATRRISGIDTAAKLGKDDYFIHDLPFMFTSWGEYRDYLLVNLITDERYQKRFADRFRGMEERYPHEIGPSFYRAQINSILTNDVEMTKLSNWEASHFTTKRLADKEAYGETIS